jgi:peptidoglycan-N-acetylglucosamine deacetylase
MANHNQIFQTNNKKRWRKFKWGSRLFFLFGFICITTLAISITHLFVPQIPLEGGAIKKALTTEIPEYRASKLGKEYRGFKKAFETVWNKKKHLNSSNSNTHFATSKLFNDSIGIRAAFYVAWDPQSYTSLKKNISKINLLFPEWFFIDPNTDTLVAKIDKQALALMKSAGTNIMPILSNNYKEIFRGDVVHRIINNPLKKEKFINSILSVLLKNKLQGINIDFEDLKENFDEPLIAFQKDLYEKLHANNLVVTQDIIPFNDDYNFKELVKYNDYLILMAYDEHTSESEPGTISNQKWIEAAVEKMMKFITPKKIILGIAGYGYDWKVKSKTASNVTYQQALARARESDNKIIYDNSTYNLHFQYQDDNDSLHEVHFTDAATNFNSLRYVTEMELAGSALWRLGSEDSRLWDFYDKPMTRLALANFNFSKFNKVESNTEPDYFGEGEILDVIATPTEGIISLQLDKEDMLIAEENYEKLPSTYVIKKWGKPKPQNKIVLSFDDGPDEVYTKQILDTLSHYHVPAVFFIVGMEAEKNIPIVKRIYNEGHELGNHTFTHPNMAEVSRKRALLEMDGTRLLIECITGHSTILFRAPFNADSEPEKTEELIPVALSRSRNYITVGESIDPEDWQKGEIQNFNADTIFNRVVKIYNNRLINYQDSANIILLHDAGGDRSETVKATGMIIRYFKNKGYSFTNIAGLLGKTPNDLMPEVPKEKGFRLLQFNAFLIEMGYWLSNSFMFLFILFIVLGFLRALVLLVLSYIKNKKSSIQTIEESTNKPLVSIIVPAYNEEVNAVTSLHNLLQCDYENFEIIFVDDGSKDATLQKVQQEFTNHPKVKILSQPNGGKATALNFGIKNSTADFVVCIDADTKLKPNAVRLLMNHFKNPLVAAVAGNVKVGNEINLLTKWQSIEYIISQNFERKAFDTINTITVIPGAIGAFRKNILLSVGGFTTDTLAEDCDLTIKILKQGYKIEDEPKAIALTEAPETLQQFLKQRFRWTFGVMQTVWKNRNVFFNTNYKSLGWIAFPDILLFKYIIPLFSPLADVLMFLGLFSGNASRIGTFYLLFLFIDLLIALIAFSYEKENIKKIIWIIPQRIIYRWLMLYVLFKSYRKAIKGELQSWGILKRTGNVTLVNS